MFSVTDCRGVIPESWACIDCGINTAPGFLNRASAEQAFAADWNKQGIKQTYDERAEVYIVKPAIWKAAGMEDDKELWNRTGTTGGCLCIGCLEKRLGRTLIPRDFLRNHPLNSFPCTKRLLARRTAEWNPTTAIAA